MARIVYEEYSANTDSTTKDLEYFVDAANGDDDNPGTEILPFQTLQKAMQVLPKVIEHDVTINIADGSYYMKSEIGDTVSGGRLFYILKEGDNGYSSTVTKGLVAATERLADLYPFSNVNEFSGAINEGIGYGLINSQLITSQAGHTASAALACLDFEQDGYTDWYLPSLGELQELQKQKQFFLNIFSFPFFWTSTEDDEQANLATRITLFSGTVGLNTKGFEIAVVPMRTETIAADNPSDFYGTGTITLQGNDRDSVIIYRARIDNFKCKLVIKDISFA